MLRKGTCGIFYARAGAGGEQSKKSAPNGTVSSVTGAPGCIL